jgi:hypothetical protein
VPSGDSSDYNHEASVAYFSRKIGEIPRYYVYNGNVDGHYSNVSSNYSFNTRNETGLTSSSVETDRSNSRENNGSSISGKKLSLATTKSNDMYDKNWAQLVSPTGQKVTREHKPDKQVYWLSIYIQFCLIRGGWDNFLETIHEGYSPSQENLR